MTCRYDIASNCRCFSTKDNKNNLPYLYIRREFLRLGCVVGLGFLPSVAAAQNQERIEKWSQGAEGNCDFYSIEKFDADVFVVGTSQDAVNIVRSITSAAALRPNFEVLQANVNNARAVLRDGKRYILFSEAFISQIRTQTESEWSAWTILAHEVGHHLNGHTLLSTGSQPALELEADLFAGFAVARMGGTLQQALLPYRQIPDKVASSHPPRAARIEAVTCGFNRAVGGGSLRPRAVRYSKPGGRFERQGDQWVEINGEPGDVVATFDDNGVFENYVLMFDKSRNFYLRFPLGGGVAEWSNPNPLIWSKIFVVRPVEARGDFANSC